MTERSRIIKYLNCDFFTETHRITGRIGVGMAGLEALLDDTMHSLATVEDAYLSRIDDPGAIIARRGAVRVPKAAFEFIAVYKREDIVQTGKLRSPVRAARHPVLVVTHAFEIRGILEQPGKLDPDAVLLDNLHRYFTLYNAVATACDAPDVQYTGEMILVNRTHTDILCGNE